MEQKEEGSSSPINLGQREITRRYENSPVFPTADNFVFWSVSSFFSDRSAHLFFSDRCTHFYDRSTDWTWLVALIAAFGQLSFQKMCQLMHWSVVSQLITSVLRLVKSIFGLVNSFSRMVTSSVFSIGQLIVRTISHLISPIVRLNFPIDSLTFPIGRKAVFGLVVSFCRLITSVFSTGQIKFRICKTLRFNFPIDRLNSPIGHLSFSDQSTQFSDHERPTHSCLRSVSLFSNQLAQSVLQICKFRLVVIIMVSPEDWYHIYQHTLSVAVVLRGTIVNRTK